ncbi:unnamed protein product [Ectocarpus sp. CCAP 1310/34]|nr:unnamed protein product [Ectocarpus sp. CCAP 1310/34]
MFSCCALFSQTDEPADTEHLKALDDVDAAGEGEMSIKVDGDNMMAGSGEFDGTPVASSPRVLAAQRSADDASSAMQIAEREVLQAKIEMSRSEVEGKAAAEAEAAAQEATREAEADVAAAEEARIAAQTEAETASAERAEQTMRALREAEDAAHAAAEEAERRRFEEEASARAARQAETEARKALWRAEEAQKMKEQAGSKALEEAAAVRRIAQEEATGAELARRQATAVRMETARKYLTARLLSDEGVRLLKHGRNGKSMHRTLRCPDQECGTLTWGKTLHDLRLMQEVRRGTEVDPSEPNYTGTSELRRSKAGRAALDRSFSLLFPSRSLDFTVASKGKTNANKWCSASRPCWLPNEGDPCFMFVSLVKILARRPRVEVEVGDLQGARLRQWGVPAAFGKGGGGYIVSGGGRENRL